MATKIIHKKSSVADRIPVAGDLEVGELALNLTDKMIYTKQSDGTVVELSTDANTLEGKTVAEIEASALALAIALG